MSVKRAKNFFLIFFSLFSVKPVIQLNTDVISDDELYSDVEQDTSINVPMDTNDDRDADPDFEVPMTPVPSKKRKPVLNNVTPTTTSRNGTTKQHSPDSPVSTPGRSFTRKRRPAVEPDLNMRPKQGYTSYPAHLFDIPPACLNVEHLHKKFLLTEIEKSRAEKIYLERGISFIAFLTEAARTIAQDNGYRLTLKKDQNEKNDHEYCMSQASASTAQLFIESQKDSNTTPTVKSKL